MRMLLLCSVLFFFFRFFLMIISVHACSRHGSLLQSCRECPESPQGRPLKQETAQAGSGVSKSFQVGTGLYSRGRNLVFGSRSLSGACVLWTHFSVRHVLHICVLIYSLASCPNCFVWVQLEDGTSDPPPPISCALVTGVHVALRRAACVWQLKAPRAQP